MKLNSVNVAISIIWLFAIPISHADTYDHNKSPFNWTISVSREINEGKLFTGSAFNSVLTNGIKHKEMGISCEFFFSKEYKAKTKKIPANYYEFLKAECQIGKITDRRQSIACADYTGVKSSNLESTVISYESVCGKEKRDCHFTISLHCSDKINNQK